ncbi:MAG: hypothetical protein HKM93_05005 [Desulfobacteraceae bacterium]|nr:hypothetical protein [Desulfobacteraceae bacterium]
MRYCRIALLSVLVVLTSVPVSLAAYHHMGDTDSDIFRDVYPAVAGTKLDSCAVCHTGGRYEKYPGSNKWVDMGSCQWCHYTYGYDESGDIDDTLNDYGRDFRDQGRNADALQTIADLDSDGDGHANGDEIQAVRFPGDATDDPTMVPAPFRIFERSQLEQWPLHEQFLLMNTHKSGDFYALYSGVPVEDLLDAAGILPTATGIRVYAPDGWSQYHPLDQSEEPSFYPVYGEYPPAVYYYDQTADVALYPDTGWCSFDSIGAEDLSNGDSIGVEDGLRLLLAFTRDSAYLESGELDASNRLNGEGPFRVVPPQKKPGPPDQSVKSDHQDVIWPFDENADHNAGFATRTTTIIKVDPLPDGFTDINTLEAGWNFVDEGKIVVYGAIDPSETIYEKFDLLMSTLMDAESSAFKRHSVKFRFILKIWIARLFVEWDRPEKALDIVNNRLITRVDGCALRDLVDYNDWIITCDNQKPVYWQLHELKALINLLVDINSPAE